MLYEVITQLAIVLVVHLGLGFTVPLVPVALLIAASAAVISYSGSSIGTRPASAIFV